MGAAHLYDASRPLRIREVELDPPCRNHGFDLLRDGTAIREVVMFD